MTFGHTSSIMPQREKVSVWYCMKRMPVAAKMLKTLPKHKPLKGTATRQLDNLAVNSITVLFTILHVWPGVYL